MNMFGRKKNKTPVVEYEYTPEQLEALAELDVQKKEIELQAAANAVLAQQADIEHKMSKTRVREAQGGRGLHIVFHQVPVESEPQPEKKKKAQSKKSPPAKKKG